MRRLLRTLALFLALSVGTGAALSCRTGGGDGQNHSEDDIHLTGKAGELFRKLTGAKGMTLSEKRAVYATENPPGPCIVAHENEHKVQAQVIGDALVAIGAIDDDEISRMGAWVSIYSLDWVQRGYEGNRFEQGAKAAAKAACSP